MRVIHKAALVFMLRDIYSKMPITNAVILCNGKQNPYTRKKEGYYVFSNLYPMEYEISISAKGYTDLNFNVTLRENETQVFHYDMPYSVDNESLTHLKRFEILVSHKKERLNNKEIKLVLKNEAKFMKVIEPAEAGTDELKLNLDMTPSLIGQNYIYEHKKQENEFSIWGYDNEKKVYTLKNPLENEIQPGGKIYPFWNLKTDSLGRITMPAITQFMTENEVKFQVIVPEEELSAKVSLNLAEASGADKVFYLNARLRKKAEKEK